MSELDIRVNHLKQKLIDSSIKEDTVRDRDFGIYQTEYLEIYQSLGRIFYRKPDMGPRKHAVLEYDITQEKLVDFIPELSIENVNNFVKLFSHDGLEVEHPNLLFLLRSFHKAKYR